MFPAILGAVTAGLGAYRARQMAKAATAGAVGGAAGFAAPSLVDALTDGPEPFEGAPDNPGDVGGATRLRWDYRLEQWVPFKSRRRKRALTASDQAAIAFLRSQGLAAKDAAGLVMAGVGRRG